MSLSLRRTVIGAFSLILLGLFVLGVLAIGLAVQSDRQITSLEKRSVVPAIGLEILSQNLDQERALLASGIGHMKPEGQRAVREELTLLDVSVNADARRILRPHTMSQWRKAWSGYLVARTSYLRALRARQPAAVRVSMGRTADRLNAAMDVAQSETGVDLYGAENLYTRATAGDWTAIHTTIWGFLLALAVGVLLAVYIVRRVTCGLADLTATADSVSRGELDIRARVGGRDEIGVVATAFNHMLDALLSAERQARADGLTGLLNHRAFYERLSHHMARVQTDGLPLCLLMIDINDFKLFNDAYGHQVGDSVLRTVATIVQNECRATDVVARYGGDEFVVLMGDTGLDNARSLAARIDRAASHTPIQVGSGAEHLPLSLSIGLAHAPDDAGTAMELVELADQRMYEIKRSGGGVWGSSGMAWTPRLSMNTPFSVLDGLVTAIDNKDRYTREHSEWVARFADLLAEALEFAPKSRQQLTMGALIHDIGKVGIPDHILKKPYKLTDQEYETMRQHVTLSELLVSQIAPSSDVLDAVRHHHERWDGEGYPRGVSGLDVPLVGRIMIIADAASAMFLDRPYRKGLTLEQLVSEVQRNRGTQFDPDLADLFVAKLVAAPEWIDARETHAVTVAAS